MFKKIIVLFVMVVPFGAFAQSFKVEKVKGNKALVEVTSGSVRAGESYNTGSTSSYGSTSNSGGGTRNNILGLSAVFSSLSTSVAGASVSATILDLAGRYGWNKEQYEYGALAEYSSVSSNGTSMNSLAFGGFYDYNLTPNRSGTDTVFGPGGTFTIGNATVTGTTTSSSFFEFFGGGFGKFLVLKTTTAIRGDLGYRYRSVNSDPKATISGLSATLGLSYYY
jgi:hypothetical protein